MSKVIRCKLDSASIGQAIKELQDYRKGLEDKIRQLVESLAKEGVEVAKAYAMAAQGDSEKPSDPVYTINPNGDIVTAQISITGDDILFIEFGAGIYYNNGNNHPKAAELGYGVGTYPSEHPPNRAINPGYWWYKTDKSKSNFSLGTEATMPMYHAAENARNTAIKKAIEIFSRS